MDAPIEDDLNMRATQVSIKTDDIYSVLRNNRKNQYRAIEILQNAISGNADLLNSDTESEGSDL
jgi:hypothetical protein